MSNKRSFWDHESENFQSEETDSERPEGSRKKRKKVGWNSYSWSCVHTSLQNEPPPIRRWNGRSWGSQPNSGSRNGNSKTFHFELSNFQPRISQPWNPQKCFANFEKLKILQIFYPIERNCQTNIYDIVCKNLITWVKIVQKRFKKWWKWLTKRCVLLNFDQKSSVLSPTN